MGGKIDRTRLRPEVRQMLETADALGAPSAESLSVVEARQAAETRLKNLWGEKDPVGMIEDLAIAGPGGDIRARIYANEPGGHTVLFFHGGGWVLGSLDTHDGAVRALARSTRANVLSVEYRKAPEAPYPAALDDAECALNWLFSAGSSKGLSPDRVVVAGDSAGASISAVLAVRARDRGRALGGQVLIYPATDLGVSTESRDLFAEGFALTRTTLEWYIGHYLSGGTPLDHPEVSPLRISDLRGLPPAFVVTADHDPLRDEGRAYAQRLIAAGNDVCYEEWRGVTHGFFNMDRETSAARELSVRIGAWTSSLWGR